VSGEERAVRSICVAGAGIVGLSAALAFARALPGVSVTILQTTSDPAALADRMPGTLPTVHRFHAAIGVDELELVRSGIAVHRLGTRFDHWSADGRSWYHVFGEHGLPAGEVPFVAVWQNLRERGQALPFDRYAAAAALAAAGKFVHPASDPDSPLGTFLYGLRLDPARYRERLAAAASNLPRVEGEIKGVEHREDGGIQSLLLGAGRRIAADLFLDCSGPAALLHAHLAADFEDWSGWLPCDRIATEERAPEEPNPCDTVTASGTGWTQAAALPGRTLVIRASSAEFGPGEGVAIRTGRRPRPWIANVLAIGDAAVAVDPLQCTNLHLAQAGILLALELMPGRDCHPLELREYNRRFDLEVVRVRDFQTLHYVRSGRRDTPFWAALGGREPPPTLARTLEQFERRGRLPFFEEETFDRDSWLAVLLGLGVMPRHADPAASGLDPDRTAAATARFAERVAALPARFPSYREVLAKLKQAPPRRPPQR
jgi:tryptophan halogenase